MAVDINRATSGVELPLSVSNEVIQTVQEDSAVMQLANTMTIGGNGVVADVITGDPTASWVAETDEKPVSTPTISSKKLVPYKLAVIVPFSNQFRRDKDALYSAIVSRIPGALAAQFDATVLHGTAPGTEFDTLAGATAYDIATDTYSGLVSADAAVATAGGIANGIVLSPQAKATILNAVDSNKRPIFISDAATQGEVGSLLGIPTMYRKAAYLAGTPNTLGIIGDWSQATVGIVGGVDVTLSDQATITVNSTAINLWQRNMFAVRAEVEVGFVVSDAKYFGRLTDAASA